MWSLINMSKLLFRLVMISLLLVTEIGQTSSQTGIDLKAIDIAGEPEWWSLEEAASGRVVTKVKGRWGFTSTPAGDYRVLVFSGGKRALPVVWDTVTVAEGTVTHVSIDSGITISGSERWSAPPKWWFVDDAAGKRVAQVYNRWGFTPLPPGSYRITIIPQGDRSVSIDWEVIEITDGEVSQLTLTSGIELKPGNYEGPMPDWWLVDNAEGERVAQIKKRWGFTPLPPGQYKVELPFGYATGTASVDVRPNQVSQMMFADLGVGRVVVELPAAQGVNLVGVPGEFQLETKIGDQTWGIPLPEGGRTKRAILGLKAEPLTLIFRNGFMEVNKPIRVEAGKEIFIPFDAESLAREQGLSMFSLGDDNTGRAGGELLVARGADSEPLMLHSVADGTVWLAPGNAYLRWRRGDKETVIRELTTEEPVSISMPSSPGDSDEKGHVWVDVAIQSPSDGAVVEAEQVELVGRAATGAEAGTTQIAILIDTSGSTADPSGVDLNGDGKEETVLEAEVAAARILVEELGKIEAENPGDAFAVGLLRFSDGAERMASLTRLSAPNAIEGLVNAFDRLIEKGPGGDTYYDKGLDAAVDAIEESRMRGPRIILLMSDGKPSDLQAALAAATRTGRAHTVIHALGLGKDFKGNVSAQPRFPPYPSSGVDTLGLIAALAHAGGEVFPSPRPGDAVAVLTQLPILKKIDAGLKTVLVENVTTAQAAKDVSVSSDGSFIAQVPISLLPTGEYEENTLRVTAIAIDDVSRANDQVRIKAPRDAAIKRRTEELADCVRIRSHLETKIPELSAKLNRCEQVSANQRSEYDLALEEVRTATSTCAEEKHELSEKLDELQSSVVRFEANLESLNRDQADLLKQKEECSLRVAELEQALKEEQWNASDCATKHKILKDERMVLREQFGVHKEECANTSKQYVEKLQQAQVANTTLVSRLESALSELAETKTNMKSLSRDKVNLSMRAAQCNLRIGELEQALQEEQKNLAGCAAKRKSLYGERTELHEQMRQRENVCADKNKQLATKLQQAQADQGEIELRLKLVLSQSADTKSKMDEQRAACDSLEEESKRFVKRAEAAELEVSRLQTRSLECQHCEKDLRSTSQLIRDEQRRVEVLRSRLEARERTLSEAQTRIARLEKEHTRLISTLDRCPETLGWLRVSAIAKDGGTPQYLLPQVELILDVSNSMWGQIEGESKISIARRVIRNVVSRLPSNIRVALRVYGHRKNYREIGSCTDSELLLPFATLDRERLINRVNALMPKGKTPIAYSLRQVTKDFAGVSGQKVVILVTDGEEECGGNPIEAAAKLANTGLNVIKVHVVGFALSDERAKEIMKQVAEATEGRFLDAQSSSDLEDALSKSFRIPYQVLDTDGMIKAEGHVDHDAIEVPPGEHRVVVNAPNGPITFDRVTILPDETTELTLGNKR